MTATARSPRLALVSGWEISRSADGGWRAVDAPLPVAALLADAGEWRIDGPARRFDAETWYYRLRLDAPAAMLAAGGRFVFDGLATCCEVSFNGAVVLGTRNMFRAHAVDIPAAAWKPSASRPGTQAAHSATASSTVAPGRRRRALASLTRRACLTRARPAGAR